VPKVKNESERLVDLRVDRWITNTPMAWLVIIDGKRTLCPFSQCEFNDDEGIMTMPEWLAIEKDLV
jgi:hypothetical protein